MEPIPLRSILGGLVDPAHCKLHCALWNGEEHPIDHLSNSWNRWVEWNSWRGQTDHFNRQFIFSMAQVKSEPSLWLFGGVFEVLSRSSVPQAHSYEVTLRSDLMGEYVKRLRVAFHMPGRNARLNMENQVDQMTVDSILSQPYSGEPFPGHDQINHTFAELQIVVSQSRPDWRIALQHMKGVYVIHDRLTGEPYVGAAYGETGIWQRLNEYCLTLHGNNEGLKALIAREDDEYARANLSFALLEYWSMRTDDQHVLDRESYWKEVLRSRTMGNNRN